ncbi:hypothetical protein ACSBR2_016045 [Camellia fascicularis]
MSKPPSLISTVAHRRTSSHGHRHSPLPTTTAIDTTIANQQPFSSYLTARSTIGALPQGAFTGSLC